MKNLYITLSLVLGGMAALAQSKETASADRHYLKRSGKVV